MMNELARTISRLIEGSHQYFANSDDIAVFYSAVDTMWIAQIASDGQCVELPNGFAEGDFSTTAEGALLSLHDILCKQAADWADGIKTL